MKLKRLTMMALTICLTTMYAGCSGNDTAAAAPPTSSVTVDVPISVCVITGVHSNANVISVNAAELGERIYECAYTYGTVSLIRADGRPEEYFRTLIPAPSVDGLSKRKLEEIAVGYRNEILAQFEKNGLAKYPELDTLDAVRLGANSLKSVTEGDKYLLIADTGLDTTGYLNFATDDLFNTPSDEIIAELVRNKAIPDLSGVKVIWLYAGQTAEPQQRLSEVQKAKLIEIWYAVLAEGNAAEIVFRPDSASSTPYTDLPDVSIVAADDRIIDVVPIEKFVLDSNSVSFVGDKADFVDQNKAEQAIQEVAQTLLNHPDNKVYIAGCTASAPGKEEFCKKLSEKRAEAVMSLLQSAGVPQQQMKAVGLGTNSPWHVPDLDADGHQIEEYARQNRCVVVLDQQDTEYGDLVADYIH